MLYSRGWCRRHQQRSEREDVADILTFAIRDLVAGIPDASMHLPFTRAVYPIPSPYNSTFVWQSHTGYFNEQSW